MPAAASANDAEPFYKTIDTPPAPELTPAQAMDTFVIAPGFEVTLVAAEPLVEDPVAITWDEFGLMYVVEMRGYMPDAYGNGKMNPLAWWSNSRILMAMEIRRSAQCCKTVSSCPEH